MLFELFFFCRRRFLALRNLDIIDSNIDSVVQKFPRQSKYEVGAAEWNPTNYHKELCVISVRIYKIHFLK